MDSKETTELRRLVGQLGKELVGVVPGVVCVVLSAKDGRFFLKVMCLRKARAKVLEKIGDTYHGHKIRFEIVPGLAAFART